MASLVESYFEFCKPNHLAHHQEVNRGLGSIVYSIKLVQKRPSSLLIQRVPRFFEMIDFTCQNFTNLLKQENCCISQIKRLQNDEINKYETLSKFGHL